MKKAQICMLILLACCFNAFTGTAQGHTSEVQSLLAQRAQLANQNADYLPLEKQIVELGYLPPALVVKTIHDNHTAFTFVTYKNIREGRETAIADRLRSSVPSIQSLQILQQHVDVTFSEAATESDIAEFFKLMGYNSYEIKN